MNKNRWLEDEIDGYSEAWTKADFWNEKCKSYEACGEIL
jgi:hypothetical protein